MATETKVVPSGVFIGIYKGIAYYANQAKIQCLFGWLPKEFDSIRAFKLAVTRREKQEQLLAG